MILPLLFAICCSAQSLTPQDALTRYLEGSTHRHEQCQEKAFAIHIDASLPKLKKSGTMNGFRLLSGTGQIIYRALRFTGDSVVKTDVIARFLSNDAAPREDVTDTAITEQNYSFSFDRLSPYNGINAYVYLLKPRRKRVGLLKGELWLNADTAAPLRLWGDSVKSPSILVGGLRVVQDYQTVDACEAPLRLLVSVRTRIVGQAEMAMWLHPVRPEAAASSSVVGVMASAPAAADAPHEGEVTSK